jgi:hypothetical protein
MDSPNFVDLSFAVVYFRYVGDFVSDILRIMRKFVSQVGSCPGAELSSRPLRVRERVLEALPILICK